MIRYNNNKGVGTIGGGRCLEKLQIIVSVAKHVSFIYIYVNSDVTDTFTYELWFC